MPSVEETMSHSAYPTAIFNLEPTKKGMQSVAAGRGGPFNISWEIHGSGPIKILVRSLP